VTHTLLLGDRKSPFVKGDLEGFTALLNYNRGLKNFSRQLRSNMTDAERLLWSKIRLRQLNNLQFYRQKIVGNYIADFLCYQAKIVIEVDGSQHLTTAGQNADLKRDQYFRQQGYRVLRFTDLDVLVNINGVVESILETIDSQIPLNPPLEKGEGLG
jgi:very-short-patch-repair endonuclease